MTRDLAALARTLDALRALHVCPLCHGSGEMRDEYGDTVSCSSCDGSGIAAPRAEDDVVSQMSRAAQSIDRVVDADVTALRDRLDAVGAATVDINGALNALADRVDAAERATAHEHRRLDAIEALSQQGRDRVEEELAARLDAAEKALAGLEARALEAERESARAWRTLDRLRAWRPCPVCALAGSGCHLPCEACDDTGVASPAADPSPELVAAGERVLG